MPQKSKSDLSGKRTGKQRSAQVPALRRSGRGARPLAGIPLGAPWKASRKNTYPMVFKMLLEHLIGCIPVKFRTEEISC